MEAVIIRRLQLQKLQHGAPQAAWGVIHDYGEGLAGCGMRVYCTRHLDRIFITQEDRKCHASIANFMDPGFDNMGEISQSQMQIAEFLVTCQIAEYGMSTVCQASRFGNQAEWWKKGNKKP